MTALLGADDVTRLSDDALREMAARLLGDLEQDRRENQIVQYRPASPSAAEVHRSAARILGVGGGNGSSKTETCLVELIALATGVFPDSIRPHLRGKFRGAIKTRVVLESLTTTLHPIILPKLQWWTWTGLKPEGGPKGHWGWIPRDCLIDGEWSKSWSEKLRTLTVLCRDPGEPAKILGRSSIQMMSHDQDPTDFASGDFELVLLDEPPPLAIFRENQARTMRADGRIMLAMTWPDDPSIPVDWIFDEIYERAQPGHGKDPEIDWFVLQTTDNPHLNQTSVAAQAAKWSAEMRAVRLQGQPIRFSNLIHPLFSDNEKVWCFGCRAPVYAVEGGACPECGGDVERYCHVEQFEVSRSWPVVFALDPHPRKPHMFLWVQVDPADDLWVFAEGQCPNGPAEAREMIERTDSTFGITRSLSLIDPNMGASPSSAHDREMTWQREFRDHRIECDLADDSDVGRKRINDYLMPDERTRRPRLIVHPRCTTTILQMKRYSWADHRRKDERDLKEQPRDRYSDFPTLLKYILNADPSFRLLHGGAPVIRRGGSRHKGY